MTRTQPWLAHYDADVPPTLAPYPERTLLDYLSETAGTHPDRPALIFKGNHVSYAQLERESDALAAALAADGVTRGDRVALCLPNCPQFIIAELAAWKAGAKWPLEQGRWTGPAPKLWRLPVWQRRA